MQSSQSDCQCGLWSGYKARHQLACNGRRAHAHFVLARGGCLPRACLYCSPEATLSLPHHPAPRWTMHWISTHMTRLGSGQQHRLRSACERLPASMRAGGLADGQDAGGGPHGVRDARRHGPEHARRHHARVPLGVLPRAHYHRPARARHRCAAGARALSLPPRCSCRSSQAQGRRTDKICSSRLGLISW